MFCQHNHHLSNGLTGVLLTISGESFRIDQTELHRRLATAFTGSDHRPGCKTSLQHSIQPVVGRFDVRDRSAVGNQELGRPTLLSNPVCSVPQIALARRF